MSNKLDLINKLRDIRDELYDIDIDETANTVERAIDLCDAVEHINLAKHHLCVAINKLIILNCFEKEDKE